ncbi:MAG TPA: hypothetical protein VI997_09950 [Candidatus Thermoplasmatota archaeon]|nr:hypothetical protein [Candidatus Thermoplasmatota archaeon]
MARFAPVYALLILLFVAGTSLAASERTQGHAAEPSSDEGPADCDAETSAEQTARPPRVEVTVGLPRVRLIEAALAATGLTMPSSSAEETGTCRVGTDGTLQCSASTQGTP